MVSIPDEKIVVKSADILRKNILTNIENEEKLTCPPTVEQLENEKRSPPQVLLQFLHRILHSDNNHHIIGEKKNKVGRSIADDLMYAVSRGSYLTLKHCSIGLGLHSLTGLKQPIVLLSKLGHFISYEQVAEIETAQEELAFQLQKQSQFLPIQPREDDGKVKLILIHYYINSGGGGVGRVSTTFGRCHLGDAVWALPFGRCRLGAAVWAMPFGRCRLGAAVWALPFGRFRKVLYYRQKILII